MDTDLASIWRPEVYQIWRNLALCWFFSKNHFFFYFSKPNISAVHLGLSATGQASASVLFSGSVQKRFTRASRANFQTYTLLLKNNFSFYLPMFVRQKNIIFRILTWKDVKTLLFFFDAKLNFVCLRLVLNFWNNWDYWVEFWKVSIMYGCTQPKKISGFKNLTDTI